MNQNPFGILNPVVAGIPTVNLIEQDFFVGLSPDQVYPSCVLSTMRYLNNTLTREQKDASSMLSLLE